MSKASDLIERMERESGQRYESNNMDNNAVNGLMGTMARMLGESSFEPKDDIAVGMLLRHQISPQGIREKQGNEMMSSMLLQGIRPDEMNPKK